MLDRQWRERVAGSSTIRNRKKGNMSKAFMEEAIDRSP